MPILPIILALFVTVLVAIILRRPARWITATPQRRRWVIVPMFLLQVYTIHDAHYLPLVLLGVGLFGLMLILNEREIRRQKTAQEKA